MQRNMIKGIKMLKRKIFSTKNTEKCHLLRIHMIV